MKTKLVEVPLHLLRMTLYAADGQPLRPDDPKATRSHAFIVTAPGIESEDVVAVRLPTLDYRKSDPLMAVVEVLDGCDDGVEAATESQAVPAVT